MQLPTPTTPPSTMRCSNPTSPSWSISGRRGAGRVAWSRPELEALAAEHGDTLKVVKVDVDAAPGVAGRYGIQGIPTIALFRDGALVAVTVGAKPRRAIEDDLGLVRPVAS